MVPDSLRKRYFFKLGSGIVGFCISIVMQAMVSRGLGPSSFGDFSFLTSVFTQIVLFFDLGNTSGFYVKLSQRPKEFGIISFYFYFTAIGLLVFLIGTVITAQLPFLNQIFFPGQEVMIILAAALWAVLARYLQILNNITDAYGLTVKSEKGLILQKIVGVIIITLLYLTHKLDLTNYFLFQFFNTILLAGLFLWIIKDNGFWVRNNWRIDMISCKKYIKEFYAYSHPMFIGAIFGYAGVIVDRWLLQFFSGSVEQGFYGLAFQICTVSTIFGGAMSMLIMREFSIAFSKNDLKEMAHIFKRFIPLLYSLTAYISCFTAVQSEKLIYLMAGEEYKGAFLAVTIMCFYPIHQTYGQLSGSVFLATGQTGLYARLTLLSVILGLPILYFLLTPSQMGLGASGMAIKMIAIQFIFVNIQLYYNSKLLKLNFWRYLAHQLVSVGVLLCVSMLVSQLFDNVFQLREYKIVSFLLSGIIYSLLVCLIVYFKPLLFGVGSADINYIKEILGQKLSGLRQSIR